MAGAAFVFVGNYRVALIIGHVCFFAVEVAGCIVVATVWAGGVAGCVGVPVFGDGVGGGLTAKGGAGGAALDGFGVGGAGGGGSCGGGGGAALGGLGGGGCGCG